MGGFDWQTTISIGLSLTAVLLAALGIILILATAIAYVDFRAAAKRKAEQTARATAVAVARETIDKYLSTSLPSIVEDYLRVMPVQSGVSNADADAIARGESQA